MTNDEHIFVIYRDESGKVVCRVATDDERTHLRERSNAGPTRLIYAGAPRREKLIEGAQTWTPGSATGLTLQTSAGLRIVLHGTNQLEQNQQAKNAFMVAANRWEIEYRQRFGQ